MATRHSHRSHTVAKVAVGILIALSAISSCAAHELEVNRLTIVMRDQSHLSLTFRVDEIALLGRFLAPDVSTLEFAVSMAAIERKQFNDVIERARARLSSQVVLVDQQAKQLVLRDWRWGSIERLRSEIQQFAMGAVVGGGVHSHPQSSEIHVDAIASEPVSSVTVSLPVEAETILVVSYKTVQKYFDASRETSLKVEF